MMIQNESLFTKWLHFEHICTSDCQDVLTIIANANRYEGSVVTC